MKKAKKILSLLLAIGMAASTIVLPQTVMAEEVVTEDTTVETNDENIVVTTADDINKVEYEGDVYSISSVVNIIRNDGLPHHGGAWFKYGGELLTERRERMGK